MQLARFARAMGEMAVKRFTVALSNLRYQR
jgi:hypothetical protein